MINQLSSDTIRDNHSQKVRFVSSAFVSLKLQWLMRGLKSLPLFKK